MFISIFCASGGVVLFCFELLLIFDGFSIIELKIRVPLFNYVKVSIFDW